jgi:hypothetical protein
MCDQVVSDLEGSPVEGFRKNGFVENQQITVIGARFRNDFGNCRHGVSRFQMGGKLGTLPGQGAVLQGRQASALLP